MKQKFLKLGILLFGITLIFYQCQKLDDNQIIENNSERTFTIKIVHGDEHFAKSNPKVYEKLKKIKQDNTVLKEIEYSNEYDFYFNLDNIQIIEKNNYTQYTVVVERENYENNLLNYMLIEYHDGELYQYLITYPSIETEDGIEIDHYNATMQSLNGTSILSRGLGASDCLDGVPEVVDVTQEYICIEVRCTGGNHGLGEQCDCGTWQSGNYTDCTPAFENCSWQEVNVWGCGGSGPNGPDGSNNAGGGSNQDDTEEEEEEEPIETVALEQNTIIHKKNCNELLALSNNPIIKAQILSLQLESGNTQLTNEKGFSLGKNSLNQTFSGNTVVGGYGKISYGYANNKFGGVHLHPINGYFPMFSTYDILDLYKWKTNFDPSNTLGNDESLPVHIVATPQGVYALKISDLSKLQAYSESLDSETKKKEEHEFLEGILNKIYLSSNSFPTNYQREFLKYTKNLGVSLYKANDDLTAWERKEFNEDTNIVKPIKCNE